MLRKPQKRSVLGSRSPMSNDVVCFAPPSNFIAPQNEIHIWRFHLDCGPEQIRLLEGTLTDEEKSRANRFIHSRDRQRFVVSRGVLRELLGKYQGVHPSALAIETGPYGKPFLAVPGPLPSLSFNLSHSDGCAVCAVARDRNLGIDLEQLRPDFPAEEISHRYFSATESRNLSSLPPEQRAEGFFLGWTRKEAYLKARGTGLQTPLDSFSVSLAPAEPPKFLDGVEPTWHLAAFRPSERFVAALVYDSPPCELRYFSRGNQTIKTVSKRAITGRIEAI